MRKTCAHLGEKGRCGMTIAQDEELCIFHDAARADELAAMREKSVASRQAKAAERQACQAAAAPDFEATLGGIIEHGSWVVRQLAVGAIDAKTAAATTSALNQLRSAVVARDTEAELATLKTELRQLQRRSATRGR